MSQAERLFEKLNTYIFGPALPLLLLGAGLVYLIALGAFPFLHPIRTVRLVKKSGGSALHSLTMALSGTLGVGNIAGVALAVALGGAGAVFWMWVSALVSLFLKYAEIVLAMRYRQKDDKGEWTGGAMYYMKRAAEGKLGRGAAFLFALLCIFTAFSLGAIVQSATAAESLADAFCLPPLLSGLLLLGLTAPVVCGGARRIAAFTAKLIPLLSGLYLFLSLFAIFSHAEGMKAVMAQIVTEAFSLQSGGVGVFAFLTSRAIRYGVTRGLLSHEAGAGTAPMAHATADNTPAAQGILGMIEVFIDTFVFCTLTAFVLLLAFPHGIPTEMGGMALMNQSFALLTGPFAPPLLSVSVFLFAYATVISWCYYGKCAAAYLIPRRMGKACYLFLYLLFVLLGVFLSNGMVWQLTDGVLSALTLLHALFLLPLVGEVRQVTLREGLIGKGKAGRQGKAPVRHREKHVSLARSGQGKRETKGVKQRPISLSAVTVKPISHQWMS